MDLFHKINVVSCLDNISGASTSNFGLGGRRRGANGTLLHHCICVLIATLLSARNYSLSNAPPFIIAFASHYPLALAFALNFRFNAKSKR